MRIKPALIKPVLIKKGPLVLGAILLSVLVAAPGVVATGQARAATAAQGTARQGTALAARQAAGALGPAKLSVRASKEIAGYHHTITVTAHLGATTSRVVSIYERAFGSKTMRLLKTARVNSKGNLSATYAPVRSTTWIAVFAGDAGHGRATASAVTYMHASVGEKITGYFQTGFVGNQFYYVYHQTATLLEALSVAPNKAGECVKIELDDWTGKTWELNYLSKCMALNAKSHASQTFTLAGDANSQLRIRGDYIRSASDTTNINTDSGWLYIAVVN